MFVVEVKLKPIRDDQYVEGNVLLETNHNGNWLKGREWPATSNDLEVRRIVVDDNQRLTITATSNVEIVFDKEQSAAVPRIVEPELVEEKAEEPAEGPHDEHASAKPKAAAHRRGR